MINVKIVEKKHESLHIAKKINEHQIVFIVDYIKPRVIKIGYALRKKGYKVVLLLNEKQKNMLSKDIPFYHQVIFFHAEKTNSLYKKCLRWRPLVYHIFCEADIPDWAVYLIEKKDKIGKIIYDQYDIYRGFVTDRFDENAERERFCLEHADGLCCRMFETQYLKQKFQYQMKKRILFFDYCWNGYQIDSFKKRITENEKIKFVYGGRLLPSSLNDRFTGLYKIERSGFKYITETLQNAGGEFVIIPTRDINEKGFGFFRGLERKYSSLTITKPMKIKKLIEYESKMDYGIDCVELKKDMDKFYAGEDIFNYEREHQYYATNKYFDYLDAGIMPIYGRKEEKFGRYLARYGGAIYCTLEDLPSQMDILKKNKKKNRKGAQKAREIFAMDRQIGRLIAFYHEV